MHSVCKTKPKNREDLVERIEGCWSEILEPSYLIKTCQGAWDRLRRVVAANGFYLRPKESLEDDNEEEEEEHS